MKKYVKIIIVGIVLLVFGYGCGWVVGADNQFCEEQQQEKLTVITEFINIREYADRTSNMLGQVNEGDKFKIIEKFTGAQVYDWYKIEYNEGQYGWIASDKEDPYVEVK